jgi:hypothetical protein
MSFKPTTEHLRALLVAMAAVAKGALKLYYRCIKPYYHSAKLTGRVSHVFGYAGGKPV